MKKRILTFILSLTMLAGLVPVSAMEVNATENGEVIAENVTGNSVQTQTTTLSGTEYVLADKYVPGTTYVLVEQDDIPNGTWALKSDGMNVSSQQVVVADNKIVGNLPEVEWTISDAKTAYGYHLVDNNGKYLVHVGNNISLSSNKSSVNSTNMLNASSTSTCYFKTGYPSYGIYLRENTVSSETDACSNFKLYAKTENGTGGTVTTYTVDTAGLDALIAECGALSSQNYTAESWSNFETTLVNAQNVKESLVESYDTVDDANAALAEVDAVHNALLAARDALEQSESSGTTATVELEWQRTLEPANAIYGNNGKLLVDVEYITNANGQDTNYSVITWKDKAEQILALSTDPSMTVWDYGTNSQYATGISKVEGVKAATWNEHENSGWRHGSVRRFTGTFTWPAGFDVEDSVTYQSVNDANYSAIYEYINSNPDLKERFGTSKVFPVNDDMFVFIHKADDPLTVDNYLEHMLFWSGTSGKGLWSVNYDGGGGDWDRTTPATFNGVNAIPAYRGIMPNNNDITGLQATVDGLNINTMRHSDDWYTLVDSNVIMSTIKRNYGVEDLSNQEMVIEIFCFDNSGNGGMDKINLHFEKTPETATTVQINYYLDSILASNLIGSSLMSGIEHGTEITLPSGTNVNELDYYRFAAATKAGTVVSNGVQQDPVPYVVDINKEHNIINVVYTSNNADDRVYYFYDFGVENKYVYTPKEEAVLDKNYRITHVENSDSRIKASISADKKDVILTYAPGNSEGEVASGVLNIVFDGAYGTEVKPIVIAPASNTLFEENFMSQSTSTAFADWAEGGTADAAVVTDNENTVFGYTDSYKTSVGESGTYTATVNDATKFTDNLQFEFGGTGFDLIGTCGPNTGTISVRVINSSGAAVKNYLVDTSFTDTTGIVESGTTLYQVPLIQAKDLPEDIYTVTIRGAYVVYAATSAASTYSVRGSESAGGSDPIADIYELLYGVGMTEEDIDSLEYINMGRLLGASTYAANTDTVEPMAAPSEMIIGIDGFRSYRATNYKHYPTKELGVTYYNILDCVNGSFAAYIETAADGTYQVNEYELSGGPQNEIYMAANNGNSESAALTIGKSNSISKQISLRSVDGKPVTVNVNGGSGKTNGKTITLNHTTEMYYEVPANEDGYIVIQVAAGFLGIGNLKLTSGDAMEAAVMFAALVEDDYARVASAMRLYASEDIPDSEADKPEVEKPDKEESGTQKSEVEKPSKDELETQKPETEIPDKEESEIQKPKTESSGAVAQKVEEPKTETPELEKAETETPELEKAETKTPEEETSEMEKDQTERSALDEGIRFGVYAAVILLLIGILAVLWEKYQNKRRNRKKRGE